MSTKTRVPYNFHHFTFQQGVLEGQTAYANVMLSPEDEFRILERLRLRLYVGVLSNVWVSVVVRSVENNNRPSVPLDACKNPACVDVGALKYEYTEKDICPLCSRNEVGLTMKYIPIACVLNKRALSYAIYTIKPLYMIRKIAEFIILFSLIAFFKTPSHSSTYYSTRSRNISFGNLSATSFMAPE